MSDSDESVYFLVNLANLVRSGETGDSGKSGDQGKTGDPGESGITIKFW